MPRRGKFNAKPVYIKGEGKFDSQDEYNRWLELKLLEKAKEISDLQRQVEFEIIPAQDGERKAVYTCDFQYMDHGKLVVEDVKSAITAKLPDYVLRRKLMLFRHGIKIKEVFLKKRKNGLF